MTAASDIRATSLILPASGSMGMPPRRPWLHQSAQMGGNLVLLSWSLIAGAFRRR